MTQPQARMLQLMAQEPYLVRRPLLVEGDRLLAGFDERRVEAFLAGG